MCYAPRMTREMIQMMMQGKGELTCLFGSMKKTFTGTGAGGEAMEVRPQIIQRIACKTNWWQKLAPRFFYAGEDARDVYALSYPNGYLAIDCEARLIREAEEEEEEILAISSLILPLAT